MVKKLIECVRFFGQFKKIQLLLFVLFWIDTGVLFAQSGISGSGKYKQHLEWGADEYALEYKVEIRSEGKIIKSYTTSDNYVNLNLPSGSYEYRISVYDLLGRVADVSAWQKLEIAKANPPVFKKVEQTAEVDISESGKIVFPVEVDNVTEDSTVTLVNAQTNEEIKGNLVVSEEEGKSEVGKASAEFPDISDGEWKIVVENPSGLTAESPVINVKTVDRLAEKKAAEKAEQERLEREEQERLAAEKAEQERLEREEQERLAAEQAEQERLEREEQERIAAEKAEQERLEREAAERAEQERLAKEQAEREEQERLAAEKAEQERLEREEQERLAVEKAEQKRLAREERKKRKTLSIELKAGAAAAINLFDADLLNKKNYDTLTKNLLPQNITPAPYVSISYVPNFDWLIKPGIEVFANGFVFESTSTGFSTDKWEYKNTFFYNNIQANLIGQLRIIPQKIYLNIKAGGGVSEIILTTDYANNARKSLRYAFVFPKINAGLSFEFIPLKHLVLEIGADYNKVLSNKINDSYLMPYLQMGVRF